MNRRNPGSQHHIPQLDGIRGVAILMVLYFHVFGSTQIGHSHPAVILFQTARWGWSGVDLFFVLSGFLITRILLQTKLSSSYYAPFYWRRLLRIFPIYGAALVIVFFILPPIASHHPERGLLAAWVPFKTQIWFWLNMSNLLTAFAPMAVPLLSDFWTLAIEEQFYLVWPTVVRYVSLSALGGIAAVGMALPWALRFMAHGFLAKGDATYRLTPFHVEGLCGGALLAVLAVAGQLERFRRWYIAGLMVGLGGVVLTVVHPTHLLTTGAVTFVALIYTAIVALSVLGSGGWLRSAFLRKWGEYSYFIYAFHIIFMAGVRESLSRLQSLHRHPVLLGIMIWIGTSAVAFGVGALSHRYFERPILRLKRVVPYCTGHQTSAV